MKYLALATALASLAACGFGENGPANPAPRDGERATGGTGAGVPNPAPGPARRTVERRSPVGTAVDNYLVDGDFELSATIEGATPQAGWLAFGSGGQGYLRLETGGLCRTGLRCGTMTANRVLFGRATSARDTPMVASIYVKPPPELGCRVPITTYTISCNLTGGLGSPLPPATETPDDRGWCKYERRLNAQARGVCFYVDAEDFEGQALIDEARLVPDDGTTPLEAKSTAGARRIEPSPRQRKMIEMIRHHVRDKMPLGRRPEALDPRRWIRPD